MYGRGKIRPGRKSVAALSNRGMLQLAQLDHADRRVLAVCEAELARSRTGNLERIFPADYAAYRHGHCTYSPEKFAKFFESPRYNTTLLMMWHALQLRVRGRACSPVGGLSGSRRLAAGSARNAVENRRHRERREKLAHSPVGGPNDAFEVAKFCGLGSGTLAGDPDAPELLTRPQPKVVAEVQQEDSVTLLPSSPADADGALFDDRSDEEFEDEDGEGEEDDGEFEEEDLLGEDY